MKKPMYSMVFLLLLSMTSCANDGLIKAGTNTYFNGNVERGSKFGFTVGLTPRQVEANGSGLRFVGYVGCNSQLRHLTACINGDKFLLFDINQRFRKGELYLKVQNDIVRAIVWQSALGRTEF